MHFYPWTGIMLLGYGMGRIFTGSFFSEEKKENPADYRICVFSDFFLFSDLTTIMAIRYTGIYKEHNCSPGFHLST